MVSNRILFFLCVCLFIFVVQRVDAVGKYKGLEFLDPCSKQNPDFDNCLAILANILTEHFRKGLPVLGYQDIEPIILDELHISLGGGSNGYNAEFRNISATGVSSVKVERLRTRITDDDVQVRLYLTIPKIRAVAKYRSSGTLILIQASGAGDYWGEYDNVKVVVYIRAKPYTYQERQYLRLQQVDLNFIVKNIKMGVENVYNSNTILQTALNLFINSNSQELLEAMKPDLKKKLIQVMSSFVEKVFAQVPMDAWIVN